jgi:hypothetical protein
MLISQNNLPKKQPSQTGLLTYFTEEKERQIETLADSICRFLDWRDRQANMKEERKIRAMLSRRRNRERRRTEQSSL